MNPIKLSEQLRETLVDYMTTTFDVNRDGKEPALAKFIADNLNRPGALFAGPYLELTAPYKTGKSLRQLAEDGVINPKLLELPCFKLKNPKPLPIDAPLNTHQEKAIRKLCADEHNVVVSSGTGSGKTEAFLIPLLNDLIRDKSPGVRAVLIYPLNALVNDQLDRMRVLLQGTGITFGRYTSELMHEASKAKRAMEEDFKTWDPKRKAQFDVYPLPNEIIGRDQIQDGGSLPQILITNYAMLEYLMLRPQDKNLFRQHNWKFIVLDEAHTYAGAQGIEVGLLMRRLKHRLKYDKGRMRCIATSATLSDDEDVTEAKEFAEALFGEDFDDDDIILGEPNHHYVPQTELRQPPAEIYLHDQFDRLIENVRKDHWLDSVEEMALLMAEIGLISDDELSWADNNTPQAFLYKVLQGNDRLINLRTLMVDRGVPIVVERVAGEIFPELSEKEQSVALYHLIELAAMARLSDDDPSLLPARYHLFVRPPQGVWACLNPTCPENHEGTEWSKLFAAPREHCDACDAPVYPVVVCRTCGQVYLRLFKVDKQYKAIEIEAEEPEQRYVTWKPIHENLGMADAPDDEEEEEMITESGGALLKQSEMRLCLECQQTVNKNGRCGCDSESERVVTLHLVEQERKVRNKKREEPVAHLSECGRCHSKALKNTEIATEITMTALTPLAVLTEDLYRELPESTREEVRQKAGGGRKLLSFYDSRQGAARFAAFVQDVVNQQAYRRIMIEAIEDASTDTFLPDLEKTSETMLDLALLYRIAHNDPEISQGDLPRDTHYLNKSQRERLMRYMRRQLTAEITTRLRSRQSLEALGMMTVRYFEPDRVPDFAPLGQKIGLTAEETRTLVENLLDDLRRSKVVTLPEGVSRDDEIFGRNKFSPRVILGGPKGNHQLRWIGQTPRQRRRKLMKKVLNFKGLASDEAAVKNSLHKIFVWLDESGLFDKSNVSDGFQIRHDRLFFQVKGVQWYRCNNCQRFNCRGNSLPCPHHNCNGQLQPFSMAGFADQNFYYSALRQRTIPLRVEEHTAQLDSDKGQEYQNKFKAGEINMLSCSTTFEMGIDLGDLQAVVMSNIPPTVANYKQRAGRAGRRTSGTAFIMAWASNRPHDQTYFKTPEEIISGRVRVPYLDVQNKIITQRHINAILLSEFLRFCDDPVGSYQKSVGAFFDEQNREGVRYYSLLEEWINDNQDRLLSLIERYAQAVNDQTVKADTALQTFANDMRSKGYETYGESAGYYNRERQKLGEEQLRLLMAGTPQSEIRHILKEIGRLGDLLERIQKEDLINYLSDKGVLPSYSFPLHTVELNIPPSLLPPQQLRLQRNASQAIREYAPGQEVVADKRIWRSEGLELYGKTPETYAYHICPRCNTLKLESTPGKELEGLDKPCDVCGEPPARRKRGRNQTGREYIKPDGFRASLDSGQPAGQYVDRPYNLTKSGLIPGNVNLEQLSPLLSVGYDRSGTLLYVNEGEHGKRFRICFSCGKHVTGKRTNKCNCGASVSGQPFYSLGFDQTTDTLHMKFSGGTDVLIPQAEDWHFWTSLKYALLQGASRALQIERRDIDGVLHPEGLGDGQWRQTVVLYDNVPGGAGHVKRIMQNMGEVVSAALEIVACDKDENLRCEKSCYHCLREYGNQYEHHLLDRRAVQGFLRALAADLEGEIEGNIPGLRAVVAMNPAVWLWNEIERAQQEVILFVSHVTLERPTVDGRTWLDLLQHLLQRNVKIKLYVQHLPDVASGSGEAILLSIHLRLLLEKGLELIQVQRPLSWVVVIDAHGIEAQAIKTANEQAMVLDENVMALQKTTHNDSVQSAWEKMSYVSGHTITQNDLRRPHGTRLLEVQPDGKRHNEAEYFSEFYVQPVESMLINDRYIYEERQFVRLEEHIKLAAKHGTLKSLTVHTLNERDATKYLKKPGTQDACIKKLERNWPAIDINFKRYTYRGRISHDRYIIVTRTDGRQARLILGKGLDFIRDDGVEHTFLIFQDPYDAS